MNEKHQRLGLSYALQVPERCALTKIWLPHLADRRVHYVWDLMERAQYCTISTQLVNGPTFMKR